MYIEYKVPNIFSNIVENASFCLLEQSEANLDLLENFYVLYEIGTLSGHFMSLRIPIVLHAERFKTNFQHNRKTFPIYITFKNAIVILRLIITISENKSY